MGKELFAGLVLCSVVFFMEGQEIRNSYFHIHRKSYFQITVSLFCGFENAQKQPVVFVLQEKCLQNIAKFTENHLCRSLS